MALDPNEMYDERALRAYGVGDSIVARARMELSAAGIRPDEKLLGGVVMNVASRSGVDIGSADSRVNSFVLAQALGLAYESVIRRRHERRRLAERVEADGDFCVRVDDIHHFWNGALSGDTLAVLVARYQDGRDVRDRDAIFERAKGMVMRAAIRGHRRVPCISIEEFVSAGFEGLIDAIEKYERERSQDFEPYADMRVKGAMADYIRSVDVLPRGNRRWLARLWRVRDGEYAARGYVLSDRELAARLGVPAEMILRVQRDAAIAGAKSLDQSLMTDIEDGLVSVVVEPHFFAHSFPSPPDDASSREFEHRVRSVLAGWPDVPRKVWEAYLFDCATRSEAGAAAGVGESRASQILSNRAWIARLRVGLGLCDAPSGSRPAV